MVEQNSNGAVRNWRRSAEVRSRIRSQRQAMASRINHEGDTCKFPSWRQILSTTQSFKHSRFAQAANCRSRVPINQRTTCESADVVATRDSTNAESKRRSNIATSYLSAMCGQQISYQSIRLALLGCAGGVETRATHLVGSRRHLRTPQKRSSALTVPTLIINIIIIIVLTVALDLAKPSSASSSSSSFGAPAASAPSLSGNLICGASLMSRVGEFRSSH